MDEIDLGSEHRLEFFGFHPDRELNPHYADVPDVDRYGAIIYHKAPDGSECAGAIIFDGEVQRRREPNHDRWTVENWEPLTISPSVLCRRCQDHGFVREGKWVPA